MNPGKVQTASEPDVHYSTEDLEHYSYTVYIKTTRYLGWTHQLLH